jgi:thioredoxin-dependent peroxiredoxin
MAKVTLNGTVYQTNGELPEIGSVAPDFKLVDSDLGDRSLSDFAGKKKILSIVPSLDTSVCATSTEKFNQHARELSDLVVLVVSADLPFAQKRFCDASKTGDVTTLSMMRSKGFAKEYGVLIQDGPLAGIAARAVLVLDENDKVIYRELVGEIGQEPNYDAAIAAV